MELAVLTGDQLRQSLDDENVSVSVRSFLDGQFEAVLSGEAGKLIVQQNPDDQHNLEACVTKNVERYLTGAGEANKLRELDVLVTAAACVQLFVQNNWLGPLTATPPTQLLPAPFTDCKDLHEKALSYLSEDGEPVYNLSRFAGYLHLARAILLECRHLSSLQTWDWWLARCLTVQQSLLEQKSPTLRASILDALQQVSKKEILLADDKNRDVAVLFHIEASRMCQSYWEDKMAREHITQARKLAGITVELTGAMGKRTQWQQDHKAQLLLKVTHDEGEKTLPHLGLCSPQSSAPVPKSLLLDDDTVLNKINFQDEESNDATQLSPLEQALVFALMENHRRAVAQDRLTKEEVIVYLEFLLAQSSCWAVSVSALTLRCKLESDSRRRVERSMTQLEDLWKHVEKAEPSGASRLQLFYAARPLTSWELQGESATLFLSLGCTGAALDVYERLQLWEDAIACYSKMGKREKAESVIREQMALKETPSLLCFLGDVTRDTAHYLRAWELSNHRSARAMRCLAYVYFTQEKFEESVDCFEKSLALNYLQVGVWFTCGCASMAAKKYENAVRAFKRCVNLDYDNFEAWSNLATAYGRLKQKRKAFLTLQDAIKCNYEDWRLWENCLVFATDCGEFEEAMRSYNRLVDLKGKWTDVEVLGILVKATVTNMEDAGGNPCARLLPKMLELFGRITATVTSDAEIWRLYADLSQAELPDHVIDLEKTLQFLQKSQRCLLQKPDWEKNTEQCDKVSQQSLDLAKVYLTVVETMENKPQALQMLSSAKFMLKGVVSKIRQQHTDSLTGVMNEKMTAVCLNLDNELEAVLNTVERLNTS